MGRLGEMEGKLATSGREIDMLFVSKKKRRGTKHFNVELLVIDGKGRCSLRVKDARENKSIQIKLFMYGEMQERT